MNPFTRIVSSLVVLVALLLATLAMNNWLHRQTRAQIRQLNETAVTSKRAQFEQAIGAETSPTAALPARLAELGRTIGATVTLPKAPGAEPGLLGFTSEISAGPDEQIAVQVTFPSPSAARLITLFQRIILVLLLLCPLLFIAGFLIATLARRRPIDERVSRAPWRLERKQALGVEHFAKMSVERGAALAQEQGARVRAEQDLELNRALLDNAVAERIRLGRDLHDNISQTLYAVCLTLESVQKKGALAAALQQRVDHCMTELKRLNQEVRAYLQELEPARVTGGSFAAALNDLVRSLEAGQDVRIEQRLDDEAVALIAPGQVVEIMNILREAVSNSLRHGHARCITLRAGRSDQAVALAVQDDGDGFSPAAAHHRGHGLGNMEARAASLGASLRLESAPGKGTRVLLTLPVPSTA